MQETEDIVTRLEARRDWVSASMEERRLLNDAITTIATLRAEVEGLRADCARAAEVLESWRRAFPDAWSLRDQQVLVKLNRAAIDAAKAGKEGA